MTLTSKIALRLPFLVRVVRKECKHLTLTDERLFTNALSVAQIRQLENTPILAEQIDAFVSRFGRLQDTVGDKLLPLLLTALGEKTGAVIDNLDRAERLGLLESAEVWLAMRNLRNQMIHDYIEDPDLLCNALQVGHDFVPRLVITAQTLCDEIERRGWA